MTPVVEVPHAGGRYPVFVEPGLTRDLGRFAARYLPRRRLAVVTDRTVARAVPHGLDVPTLVVAPGERSKTRTRWRTLTDQLLGMGFGRDAAIVALGGGVVGDLTGFVAATYLRGIPWLQVPTSLLAMVDASVGGKTGVNTRAGKNLVGAFHPPAAVVADPAVLDTLHADHLAAGLVEAVKHGMIADAAYFQWIEAHLASLLARDHHDLTELVTRSVQIKARVVGEDEREHGVRAVLNAGHTVAHAIEQATGYSIAHGDAVAIGLVVEARLAAQLGLAPASLGADVGEVLLRLGRPVAIDPAWSVEALLEAMQHDKKTRDGIVRFALPNTLGSMARDGAEWTIPVPLAAVQAALQTSTG